MAESFPDSGWKFVNDFAEGRQRREQPLPEQQDDEVTVEVFDETPVEDEDA